MKSYTSGIMSLPARLKEMAALYYMHSRNIPARVRITIERLRHIERLIELQTHVRLENLRILDIGPGQKLTHMRYFACKNTVVGIDLDVIPQGFSPLGYVKMLRLNGITRAAKTIGRKLLKLDAKFSNELGRQLGIRRFKKLPVFNMDASNMSFPDCSFDFVYSSAVFEHISEPGAAIEEIVRVLKPGGVAYINLHLYTSDSGCHDPRIFSGQRSPLPFWAHLRPQHRDKVRSNAYLNKISLAKWLELFQSRMLGVRFEYHQHNLATLQRELDALRNVGDLLEYTNEELLTEDLAAIWRRPA